MQSVGILGPMVMSSHLPVFWTCTRSDVDAHACPRVLDTRQTQEFDALIWYFTDQTCTLQPFLAKHAPGNLG